MIEDDEIGAEPPDRGLGRLLLPNAVRMCVAPVATWGAIAVAACDYQVDYEVTVCNESDDTVAIEVTQPSTESQPREWPVMLRAALEPGECANAQTRSAYVEGSHLLTYAPGASRLEDARYEETAGSTCGGVGLTDMRPRAAVFTVRTHEVCCDVRCDEHQFWSQRDPMVPVRPQPQMRSE